MKMKKLVLLAMALILCCAGVEAQNTVVSATVVDSDSTAWANGTWSVAFIPNPTQPNVNLYNISGTPLSPSVISQKGTMNGSGALSFTIYQNGLITPVGSSWTLTVCPNASSSCGVYNFNTATNSTMNISTALTATIPAPRFPGTAGSYGYADVEVQLTTPVGATYWNVASPCQRYDTGNNTWICAGVGSGTVSGQTAGTIPQATGATTIGGSTGLSAPMLIVNALSIPGVYADGVHDDITAINTYIASQAGTPIRIVLPNSANIFGGATTPLTIHQSNVIIDLGTSTYTLASNTQSMFINISEPLIDSYSCAMSSGGVTLSCSGGSGLSSVGNTISIAGADVNSGISDGSVLWTTIATVSSGVPTSTVRVASQSVASGTSNVYQRLSNVHITGGNLLSANGGSRGIIPNISVVGCDDCSIDNVLINGQNGIEGIQLDNNTNMTVSNSTITSLQGAGINLQGPWTNVKLLHNTFLLTGDDCIGVSAHPWVVAGVLQSITYGPGTDLLIDGETCDSNNGAGHVGQGVDMLGGTLTATITNTTIRNLTVTNCGDSAIWIENNNTYDGGTSNVYGTVIDNVNAPVTCNIELAPTYADRITISNLTGGTFVYQHAASSAIPSYIHILNIDHAVGSASTGQNYWVFSGDQSYNSVDALNISNSPTSCYIAESCDIVAAVSAIHQINVVNSPLRLSGSAFGTMFSLVNAAANVQNLDVVNSSFINSADTSSYIINVAGTLGRYSFVGGGAQWGGGLASIAIATACTTCTYNVGDTFSIGGCFAGIGQVTAVSSGTPTAIAIMPNGYGYSCTAGTVATVTANPSTGVGLTVTTTVTAGQASSQGYGINVSSGGVVGPGSFSSFPMSGGMFLIQALSGSIIGTIQLSNVNLSNKARIASFASNGVLDINNYTFSGTYQATPVSVSNSATLTINGAGIDRNGDTHAWHSCTSCGTVIIKNCDFPDDVSTISSTIGSCLSNTNSSYGPLGRMYNNGSYFAPSGGYHGTTGSIGGSALSGSCATGTATVAGVTSAMTAFASAVTTGAPDTTGAFRVTAQASSNTITVSVCGTGTPTASTYAVSAQ
jgi:hypothetical protein